MANSLSQEEINFLRLAGLLIRIAPRAVRQKFDDELHPVQLQQFLLRNRRKIDDLTFKRRVITQLQYDLLYPRGCSDVSSESFDVSLMVCLLRHFTDLDIQDGLPLEHIHLPEADISRIKYYRNYIVHSDCGKVTDTKFVEIRNCLVEAIGRLSSKLKPDIDTLLNSPLTYVRDVKDVLRLEKALEKNSQRLNRMAKKLETLEIENINFEEIRQRTLNEWKYRNKKYVSTSATTFISQSLRHNKGVIITGSPGCGKSVSGHHIALELEKEGYEIIPCDEPSEILKYFTPEKFQVFVIDDICGKFTLNQQKSDSWERNICKLNMLTASSTLNDEHPENCGKLNVKFIITCRENIFSHKAFPKLTCFSLVQCSFSTKYKISSDEMRYIALSYLPEDTVNDIQNICLYDFFPLICGLYCRKPNPDPRFFTHPVEIIENEISVMKIKSESSYLCLSLLVLRNNNISIDDLKSEDVEQLVKSICRDCDIESFITMVSIQKCFKHLKGIYIIEEEGIYTAIHDKMFDIIAAAIAPSIMECLIKYADITFLANRIQLLSFSKSSLPFAIYIPQEFEKNYFERIHKEAMKGKYWEVFGGVQTENESYRSLLLSFLKEQDTWQHTYIVNDDDGSTPLFVSSSLGYLDFVKYFAAKCGPHIDVKDNEGRSSFYVACKNGHIAVVNYLMKYYEDINAEMVYKTTTLSEACLNGHTEVVKFLLDNNSDINRTNKSNQNALYFACLNGNVQLVSLLCNAYNLNILMRDTDDQTTLLTSCQKGHFQASEHLAEFERDVNQQNDIGRTPLFIACLEGHYETVKLLLDLNRPILHFCVDTTIKDIKGYSILHAACIRGHSEVVKFLIDFGMNVNDTSIVGSTPLYLACQEGHYDTVKFLLDLNGQIFNSRVDTTIKPEDGWSALHTVCFMGHTDIVRLLIDVGMDVNDTSNEGFTPIYVACMNGSYDTVKTLLDLNGDKLNSCVDTTINNIYGWSVLHVACFKGHTGVIKLLIKIGLNVNARLINGSTPLYLACQEGHYETVKYLLDLNSDKLNSCVDTTIKNIYGSSVVHVACFHGHTQVVKLLIEIGLNVNDRLINGSTPLYLACKEGHYETVKFLLDLIGDKLNNCVDTTIKNEDGWSVLHTACSNGHTQVIKLLVDIGLNVNDTSKNGCTPLFLACMNGYYGIVKYLLDLNSQTWNNRADKTIKEENGGSVLHTACANGHTEVVKLLIDVGCNVNETTNHGFTPLVLACQYGHYETVKYLLDLNEQTLRSRADLTIEQNAGLSVLHTACSNGHTDIVRLLIGVGFSINDTANNGYTPLYLACREGNFDTVKLLLSFNGQTEDSCINTTRKDDNEWSVFHVACFNGHTNVVQLLIERGININDTTNNGYTPLYLACRQGMCDTVKVLLNLNDKTSNTRVNTTTRDEDGWSVLHVACSNGHTDVVKLLIDIGMNINDISIRGETPLYLACQNGHYETVKFLLYLNGKTSSSRVDTTMKDTNGRSVFDAAFSNRHIEVVNLLIDVDATRKSDCVIL